MDLFAPPTKQELLERKERKEAWRLREYARIIEENKERLKEHTFSKPGLANPICDTCGCSTLAICCFGFPCNSRVKHLQVLSDEDLLACLDPD